MDENKQIEEMAKCCPYYHKGECCADATDISKCDLMCEMFGVFANLEVAGYRKQSEGEWLVSKTEQAWNNAEYPIERNCSVCGMRRNIETQYAWNYCPNCGAKMKGE